MSSITRGRLRARIGTYRQLEILLSVADCGGIAAAADHLNLSQPTVSAQMRKLSDAIGIPLYEIFGRRLALTQAGELVVEHARQIFDCTDRLEMALSHLKGLESGRLSVGVVRSAESYMPHLLGPFLRRHPGIEVSLHVANQSVLYERLQENLDDLCFFGAPPSCPLDVEAVALADNHLLIIAPSDHPLAGRQQVEWADIAREQFIIREEGAGIRMVVDRHLDQLGYELRHRMSVASNEGIKHAVLARLGLAIIPSLCLNEGDQRELVSLPVAGFPLCGSWYLVHRADKVFSVAAQAFKHYLLNEGREMLVEALGYWERHGRPRLPTR